MKKLKNDSRKKRTTQEDKLASEMAEVCGGIELNYTCLMNRR